VTFADMKSRIFLPQANLYNAKSQQDDANRPNQAEYEI